MDVLWIAHRYQQRQVPSNGQEPSSEIPLPGRHACRENFKKQRMTEEGHVADHEQQDEGYEALAVDGPGNCVKKS